MKMTLLTNEATKNVDFSNKSNNVCEDMKVVSFTIQSKTQKAQGASAWISTG